ncbi:integral membrane protein (TIGR01906 family) [Arthrobacter sp. V4I6]|uniref:TIGR01906 family membrane protein n=1 Tax=unclassified Arthrobacter TaxID=235627 RepID=UPI00277D4D84|nr:MULTISPECIES: TIGR01906 family membrane protein [unclassified Arthrobacter]MDQ0822126.1 integral membrane protein (TIGR01906 family) [Arthrobacter sp. V1I7]MDQ0856394.1 integral membrane protein (TIGR01906 family) [Arthrobacter sp. V4I6]
MTDTGPTPPNRQDPHLDPADDSDEPAFDWMKPASAGREEPDNDAGPAGAGSAGAGSDAEPATGPEPAAGPVPEIGAAAGASAVPGRRADRKAAEAAAASPGPREEPPHTSALQIRPPQEEVERRNAEREHAANTKPVLPRVMQVLLAICFPIILLVIAVRAVTSPLFLWVEYNRPGFPGDGYGFSTDDRMTYGSYAVDYLSNWSGPRYLGELVDRSGDQLFKEGEVSHMADVKLVILSAFGAGVLLILLSLIAITYLRRRSTGGVRRGLFAGSMVTLVLIIGLAVLAVLGWEQFFTEFHRLFFASGTWTFSLQDTLIRLFPGQFWVDAGIVIGAMVLLVSLATLILTWPTRKRRGLPKRGPAAGGTAGNLQSTDGTPAEDAAADGPATGDAAEEPAGIRSRFKRAKARKTRAAEGAAEGPGGPAATDSGTGADAGTDQAEADGKPSRGHSSTV